MAVAAAVAVAVAAGVAAGVAAAAAAASASPNRKVLADRRLGAGAVQGAKSKLKLKLLVG